jgi:hypothetical protein
VVVSTLNWNKSTRGGAFLLCLFQCYKHMVSFNFTTWGNDNLWIHRASKPGLRSHEPSSSSWLGQWTEP